VRFIQVRPASLPDVDFLSDQNELVLPALFDDLRDFHNGKMLKHLADQTKLAVGQLISGYVGHPEISLPPNCD
jgi:hypothetical protein